VNGPVELSLSSICGARLHHAIADALLSQQQCTSAADTGAVAIRIIGEGAPHFVGVGLSHPNSIDIVGPVGDYAFCGADNVDVTVDGDAGEFAAHSLRSGQVVIKGSVTDSLGSMAVGGLVAVYGSAGARAGICLHGADIFVRGNVGAEAGFRMQQGTIIIGGNAGEQLGKRLQGGTIYLRGDAVSISADIEEQRLREPDRLKLGLLLLKAGIKTPSGKDFRVFRRRLDS